jgi:predicted nucleic acid-binding protein
LIFVDTSAWYAIEVEDDLNHEKACAFLSKIASGKYGVSITTDYILDETLTLLRSRTDLNSAANFFDKIRKSKSVRVFWIDESLFEKALDIFKKSDHKSWSFTDSASFALMRELFLSDAFTFDSHFREAGLKALPTK